ncbi:hypothetical protein B0I37DRAFT_318739 [Chaetomium sp. MPI-CAGE-AT-0009]|nr:hypothetical protein B0I37DRAFT_318739 [Chaetomium sp. MPI-CAGE-AT-0009]
MARTKQTARRSQRVLTTWTRFYLPREQEWPTWAVDHDNVHYGPLKGVEGVRRALLGRMVDDPEQAAYIIRWSTLDALKNFLSSPACAEFLHNLPEHNGDNPGNSVESGSTLSQLTLEDASYSSPPASSRFLVLKHATEAATPEAQDLVTFTTFLVPHQVDDKYGMWKNTFERALCTFAPRGAEFVTARYFWQKGTHVWYWALAEDRWVEDKFGKPEQQQQAGEDNQSRTLFCHFFLWSPKFGPPEEYEKAAQGEAASAADPQARESWNQVIAKVMPPATAWVQERWNMRELPRFDSPEPEFDPEDPEYEKELRKRRDEFFQAFEAGETS